MFKKLLPLALFKAIVLADSASFTINFAPGEGHNGSPLGVNDASLTLPSTTGVRFFVNDDSQLKVDNRGVQLTAPFDLLTLINGGAETKGFSLVTDPPALLLNDATPSLWICESNELSRIAISIDSPAEGCIPYSIKPQLEAGTRKGGLFAREDDLTDSDGVDTDTEDDWTDNDGIDTDTEDDLTDNDGIDTDTGDDLTDNDGVDTDTDNDGIDTDTEDDWTDNDGIDTDTDSDDDQSLSGPVNPPTSATLATTATFSTSTTSASALATGSDFTDSDTEDDLTDNDGIDTDTEDDWTDNDGVDTDTDSDDDRSLSRSGPTNSPTSTTLATTATSSTSTTSASALTTGANLTDSDTDDDWTDNDGIDTDTDSDTDSDDDRSRSGPGSTNSPTGATLVTTATSATSTVSNGQVTSSDNGANHFAGAVGLSGAAGGVVLALLI
ncbi:BA75_02929T0 [Komagataella pastoris]|uniref:BA75_02929T0 n=1 Tax=Komagataella pastoris TaxID=4922 RepID=A0A1B2JDG1_PICPA|nr:BA75_02929T0 [Komagataella pastoris]